jgi:hypothetical protein
MCGALSINSPPFAGSSVERPGRATTRWTSTRSKGRWVTLSTTRPVTRGATHWESDQPLQPPRSSANPRGTNRRHDVDSTLINKSLALPFTDNHQAVEGSAAHCGFLRSHRDYTGASSRGNGCQSGNPSSGWIIFNPIRARVQFSTGRFARRLGNATTFSSCNLHFPLILRGHLCA